MLWISHMWQGYSVYFLLLLGFLSMLVWSMCLVKSIMLGKKLTLLKDNAASMLQSSDTLEGESVGEGHEPGARAV